MQRLIAVTATLLLAACSTPTWQCDTNGPASRYNAIGYSLYAEGPVRYRECA